MSFPIGLVLLMASDSSLCVIWERSQQNHGGKWGLGAKKRKSFLGLGQMFTIVAFFNKFLLVLAKTCKGKCGGLQTADHDEGLRRQSQTAAKIDFYIVLCSLHIFTCYATYVSSWIAPLPLG